MTLKSAIKSFKRQGQPGSHQHDEGETSSPEPAPSQSGARRALRSAARFLTGRRATVTERPVAIDGLDDSPLSTSADTSVAPLGVAMGSPEAEPSLAPGLSHTSEVDLVNAVRRPRPAAVYLETTSDWRDFVDSHLARRAAAPTPPTSEQLVDDFLAIQILSCHFEWARLWAPYTQFKRPASVVLNDSDEAALESPPSSRLYEDLEDERPPPPLYSAIAPQPPAYHPSSEHPTPEDLSPTGEWDSEADNGPAAARILASLYTSGADYHLNNVGPGFVHVVGLDAASMHVGNTDEDDGSITSVIEIIQPRVDEED